MSVGSETQEVPFNARLDGSIGRIEKSDGRCIIWGPASVEAVDKERDRIRSEALEEALPQLLKRSRLSLDHEDVIVGDILSRYEAEDVKKVEIGGETYQRQEFPTAVLDKDEDGVPYDGLYVCGEVWDDTEMSKDVQEGVKNGDYDSYSISGEAINRSTKMEGGQMFDDIDEVDLSAVTLCDSGMNQFSKFAVIQKMQGESSSVSVSRLRKSATEALNDTMPDGEDTDEIDKQELEETFRKAAEDVVKEQTVSRDEVEDIVEQKVDTQMAVHKTGLDEDGMDAARKVAEKTGREVEDVVKLLDEGETATSRDEKAEKPEDDEEEENQSTSTSSDNPDEDEEESGHPEDNSKDEEAKKAGDGYSAGELKEVLPEDLYSAVADHLSEPEESPEEERGPPEEEEVVEEEEKIREEEEVIGKEGGGGGTIDGVGGEGDQMSKSYGGGSEEGGSPPSREIALQNEEGIN